MARRISTVVSISVLLLVCAAECATADSLPVSDANELAQALREAKAGDVIDLAPGTYKGNFTATVSGTPSAPITMQGPVTAVLDGGDSGNGVGLYLYGVRNWVVRGMTVRNVLDGVVLDHSSDCIIDGMVVTNTGAGGVQMRAQSSNNLLQNANISYTGLKHVDAGTGLVIGSAMDEWPVFTQGVPDGSNHNVVADNHFGPYVSAQSIVLTEGSEGGEIRGNYFDATGMATGKEAGAWMEVRGNAYVIRSNTGYNGILSTLKDGVRVLSVAPEWGRANSFSENYFVVNALGYGIAIDKDAVGNKVYASNVVLGTLRGLTNLGVLQ